MSWVQQPPISATANHLAQAASANQQQQYNHQHQLTSPVTQPQYQQQSTQLQQQQQRSAFIGKTAMPQMPLPPPASLPNSVLNNTNNLQNHMQQTTTAAHFNVPPPSQMSQFKTQPQQAQPQNTWQQQNFQQNTNNTMQQPSSATSSANNWQQLPPTNNTLQTQNDGFQQNTNNWQQQQQQNQQQQANVYGNYFNQDQTTQPQSNPGGFQQNNLNSISQQQTTAQQPQYNYNDFYDNTNRSVNVNNNNNNRNNDGWGDWGDWNENNVSSNNDLQQQTAPELPNPNVIEDSFNTQNNSNNDNWQWNMKDNISSNSDLSSTAANSPPQPPQQAIVTDQIKTQVPINQHQTQAFSVASHAQQAPLVPQAQQQKNADFAVVTSKTANIVGAMKPPNTLPLTTASIGSTENILNNNLNTVTQQNIPNSVYVSQAKPVTRPPRQFASPPTGNTPIESPENSILLPQPPQAFQNDMPATLQSELEPLKMSVPLPPPSSLPSSIVAAASNPFKRAGAVKHHRTELLSTSTANNFGVPPPPADFANPLPTLAPETTATTITHLEPDNSEILHENQEVIEPSSLTLSGGSSVLPSNNERLTNITLPGGGGGSGGIAGGVLLNAERNQYMQTSQLSENQDDEFNLEIDSLPPPGLSRLVLGEPELESATQRLVTGTEEPSTLSNVGLTSLNLEERHADGEDTSVDQMPNTMPSIPGTTNRVAANIGSTDIAADRNLYQVPGESNLNNDRRVVTGVETAETITLSMGPQIPSSPPQVRSDQREVELDGENLEDEQLNTTMTAVASRNEPPLEGAAANGDNSKQQPVSNETIESRHHDKQHSKQTTARSQSNGSTGNDSELEQTEQHQPHHSQRYNSGRNSSKHSDSDRRTEKHRREKQRSIERSFGSEEASVEYSTDQERERRQRRREKRENLTGTEREREREREHGHDKYYKSTSNANVSSRNDYSRRSTRGHGSAREQRDNENSHRRLKHEKEPHSRDTQRDARNERDYENSHRRSKHEKESYRGERADDGRDVREPRDQRERQRGQPRRGERDTRADYNTIERQRRRGGDRGERNHARDFDEYRKQSSRNARDSDPEKEPQRYARNGSNNQISDPRYDPHMMYGYPNPSQYDPYKYYYEQMARTNPQAYHEWYKKYYEQQKQLMASMNVSQQGSSGTGAYNNENLSSSAAVIGAGSSSLAATDGRESVHSGRSSVHNEKDRYTQAYISQANQYHQRHYQQNAQFHHSQQQLQLQQHQHQYQQHQRSLNAAAAYHSQSFVMNSTFHGDTASVASFSSYNRTGRLSAAHSVDNISSVSSSAMKGISGHYIGHKGNLKYGSLDRYADSRSGQISLRDGESNTTIEQHRSTPLQFASLHTLVSFSSGIFVTIKPRVSSKGHLINIAKLQRLGINDGTRQLYQSFPGPLVRGLTHKKTIIDFCEEQIRLGPSETTIYARQLTPRSVEKYRASYTLMWNLLILLLRQNGMVVGTDIAELLLKNQQQFPYQGGNGTAHRRVHSISDDETSEHSFETESKSNDENIIESADSKADEIINNENDADAEHKNAENSAASVTSSLPQLSETEITEKFRNYLLYGNVNEALDWATDNNLWGHALFLASKVDRRSHANVMMKFANKLALNDPLQTLYQLMSGRTPSSVTSVQDEKWGDWRPHLSMILSNTSQKPELDRKAITTLGDSLFNRGDLYAAHFCYLMAQVSFGRYQESAVNETSLQQNLPKLVLLGSSHYKNFRDFASNEAIMMTEIYEYACSLNDEKFSLIEFQPYKYLLATRLLDYGLNLKSLMYMEQISLHIARDPSRFEASFINKVYEIADRLKYYDPVLEKTLDDQQQNLDGSSSNTDILNSQMPQNFEEQKWLQTLRSIAVQYKLDYPVPTASYPSHDYLQQNSNYLQNQINQEFAEINKQFSELNLQYNNDPNYYNAEAVQQPQQTQTVQENTENQQDYSQYQTSSMPPTQTIYGDYGNPLTTAEQQLPQVQSSTEVTEASPIDPYATYAGAQQQPIQQSSYYDPNSQQGYDAYAQQNVAAGYGDYWGQQQQQPGDENVRPTISMPKSKTYDSDDETQKKQQQAQGQQAMNQAKKGGAIGTAQQNKNDGKNTSKNSQQTNQNSGWFGGIWNKLSLKPKNQMILPDDKNPTIVWDADKKRWVNTDGEETTEENLKPPPKMSDIMPQSQLQQMPQQTQQLQQQQQQQGLQQQPTMQQLHQTQLQPQQQQPQMPPSDGNQLQPMTVPLAASSPLTNYSAQVAPVAQNVAATAAVPIANTNAPKQPSLQSNMFKMQRNRTLKNAYVDVFNPSGAPMSKAAENVLAPALPPAAVPQTGFFVPGGPAPVGNEANGAYQQQQQQEVPQFYNPSQYGGGNY